MEKEDLEIAKEIEKRIKDLKNLKNSIRKGGEGFKYLKDLGWQDMGSSCSRPAVVKKDYHHVFNAVKKELDAELMDVIDRKIEYLEGELKKL